MNSKIDCSETVVNSRHNRLTKLAAENSSLSSLEPEELELFMFNVALLNGALFLNVQNMQTFQMLLHLLNFRFRYL